MKHVPRHNLLPRLQAASLYKDRADPFDDHEATVSEEDTDEDNEQLIVVD